MVETAENDYREARRFILCDLIWESGLVRTPLVVLDIGARDALSDTRWTGLPREMVRLHGFEPDDEECRNLNERANAGGYPFVFHSTALAETTGEATLYQYAEPAANSLYPGNARLLARWCYNRALTLTSQFRLSKKSVIPTKSLADWASQAALGDIDFCKLNVQGAELDILRAPKGADSHQGPLSQPVPASRVSRKGSAREAKSFVMGKTRPLQLFESTARSMVLNLLVYPFRAIFYV
jgi:FkbM family methyltransferase